MAETPLPDPDLTLTEVFARRAESDPDAPILHEVFVDASSLRHEPLSHANLMELARRAAGHLHALGVQPQDRVVLMVEAPGHFMAWLLGAIAIGAIPVPLPGPGKFGMPDSLKERIDSVCRDCEPAALIADRPRRNASHWTDSALVLESAPAAPSFSLRRDLQEIAYLQYTSGSTGTPKGVVITHSNVMANLRAASLGARLIPEDRCVSWLPLYHDMGLIGGPLFGLYLGAAPFLMRPLDFVLSPISWLNALDQFQATLTTAPNFAFALAAYSIPDESIKDLRFDHLRVAFNGGEPIHHETVQRFLRRFASLGFAPEAFFPVYGLAEATLAVTFPGLHETPRFDAIDRAEMTDHLRALPVSPSSPTAATHVSVGRPLPEHEVLIRAPETRALCPERTIGEICVSGPSCSPGYFGRLPADPQAGQELATGDLGYLADGELFVVDRLKDLIILAGRNFSPSDIERHLYDVEGLRRGSLAALSLPASRGTEALHLVAEVRAGCLRPLKSVDEELRRRVQDAFQVAVHSVHLVPPRSIPRTSSGKIQRHRTRELLLGGDFQSMTRPGTRVTAASSAARVKLSRLLYKNLKND